jgi:SAM-dependent methyltransferase
VNRSSPTDAQPWDEIFRRDGRVFEEPAPVVHHVAEVLQAHGCRRIVDLGCGSGRHTVFLAQRGFDVLGVDNSPTALRMSRKWLEEEELLAGLAQIDIRRPLPLYAASFDGLVSTQVIHHARLNTVRATAREISRILRPGGVLFVSVPGELDADETFARIEPATFVPTSGPEKGLPHHIFTPEELCSIFPDFAVVKLDQIDGRNITLMGVRQRSAASRSGGPRVAARRLGA